MNLFDIVGPVMVGPSSSHTAGAVRIGQVSRHLLGESVKEAKYYYMDLSPEEYDRMIQIAENHGQVMD